MRSLILTVFLALCGMLKSPGQHLIGFSKEEVLNIVRTEMKGFVPDNSAVNPSFNYLKFVNTPGTKTLIVFFNENNISANIRLICDYSELDFIKAEYNSIYKSAGKYKWEYKAGEYQYLITLEEKEWYFVVYVNEKTASSEPSQKSWLWKLLN